MEELDDLCRLRCLSVDEECERRCLAIDRSPSEPPLFALRSSDVRVLQAYMKASIKATCVKTTANEEPDTLSGVSGDRIACAMASNP